MLNSDSKQNLENNTKPLTNLIKTMESYHFLDRFLSSVEESFSCISHSKCYAKKLS